jgi:hypothetical protein
MLKTVVVLAAALALAAPWASAEEKKADKPAAKAEAAKAQSKPGTSDRPAAKQLTATGAGTAAAGAANRSETRDWAKIDSNRDNLISPEEMEKYLQESWAARKK